jgi:hypothetical protein
MTLNFLTEDIIGEREPVGHMKLAPIIMEDFKYIDMWSDLDYWASKNKYPSWKKQKQYLIEIAPKYNITLSVDDWNKIFKIYEELHKKFYFLGWDIDCIPWIEAKIEVFSKPAI